MRNAVLVILSLPQVLSGWLLWILFLTVGAVYKPKVKRPFIPFAIWRPWIAKRWRFSNQFGRLIVMHPSHDRNVYVHELVHLRQSENNGICGFVTGLVCLFFGLNWGMALAVWAMSLSYPVLAMFGAWVRGYRPYWDSENERAAYAQTYRRWLERWIDNDLK